MFYAHPTALTTMDAPAARVIDVTLNPGTFADTTATVAAISDAGRALFGEMFGEGATSATLPKSRGADFAVYCERRGLTVG